MIVVAVNKNTLFHVCFSLLDPPLQGLSGVYDRIENGHVVCDRCQGTIPLIFATAFNVKTIIGKTAVIIGDPFSDIASAERCYKAGKFFEI